MAVKLVWKIASAPTGRYRSFEHRAWPTCYYGSAEGKPAAFLHCDDSYSASCVKLGQHATIKISVLHHNHELAGNSWVVLTLSRPALTLAEAKERVARFLATHPEFWPKA